MINKIIFFTGATSGLGKMSAMQIANDGATVIVLARSKEKGDSLLQEYDIRYPGGLGVIEVLYGDLTSFQSVKEVCSAIKRSYKKIDILVNNAGIMSFHRTDTEDRIESTLHVNLLSPILILELLIDLLHLSDDPKVIFTSSALHQGTINLEDMEFKTGFSSLKSYKQSKLGLILATRFFAKNDNGIHFYCQHPGIVRTELGRDANWISRFIFHLLGKSPETGAKTLTYLITTESSELTSGAYYVDSKEKETSSESYDMDLAQKLLNKVQEYIKPFIIQKEGELLCNEVRRNKKAD